MAHHISFIQDSITLGMTIGDAIKCRVRRDSNRKETERYARALRAAAMDQNPANFAYSETSKKTVAYNRLVDVIEDFLTYTDTLDGTSGIEGQAHIDSVDHHAALMADCLMGMHPSLTHWDSILRSVGLL